MLLRVADAPDTIRVARKANLTTGPSSSHDPGNAKCNETLGLTLENHIPPSPSEGNSSTSSAKLKGGVLS